MKHVCITGITRGLGRALARWFHREGWRVSGFGRNAEYLASLAAELNDAGYLEVVDVTEDNAVAAFFTALEATWGAPDLLVNNAGVINQPAPLWEVSADEFDLVQRVNVNGVANCLRHALPAMIARGSGIAINLSSGWGRSTSPRVAPYNASKFAIEGLSQAVAQEVPEGLAVAALNPGVIATDMLRIAFGSGAREFPTPEDWAKRAGPYLASLETDCNGVPLTVN